MALKKRTSNIKLDKTQSLDLQTYLLNRLNSNIIFSNIKQIEASSFFINLLSKLAPLFLIPFQTDIAKRVVANNERQIESQDRICQSPVKTAWETTSWYISLQCFLSILSFWLDFPLLRNRCLFCEVNLSNNFSAYLKLYSQR